MTSGINYQIGSGVRIRSIQEEEEVLNIYVASLTPCYNANWEVKFSVGISLKVVFVVANPFA